MQYLPSALRNKLESVVERAREVAEEGARAAIERLAVEQAKPFEHMSEDERTLRKRLRARARQLGDKLHDNSTHEVGRLIEECAYEHWHRMLFARFLAENGLLMANSEVLGLENIPVTLADCDELASEEGAANGWELAGRYASKMLPQIFRPDTPVLALEFSAEYQRALEKLLASLREEVFLAADSLGWVYQFWQSKKKDEVNRSGVKIGADELPAVTQLFTEPYMVEFLLDNGLGAWWAARRLSEKDFKVARSEEELRQRAAISGVSLEYLRFIQDESGVWSCAASDFEGWPDSLRELKVIDPCCGSGHFLVGLLRMLVPMRMELEGLSAEEAVDGVIAENLHGLELDERCVEIAAFALAMAAWTYPGARGYRRLPEMNIACTGLSVGLKKEDWLKLADKNRALKPALGALHDLFSQAPSLGSLINPRRGDLGKFLESVEEETFAALERLLIREESDATYHEAAVVAHGLASAAKLLSASYDWVTTNVPYLHSGKQDKVLKDFIERHHGNAKEDLATAFLDRCLAFCTEGGTTSVVLPQNWLFLTRYEAFRRQLLNNETWNLVARLGVGAFETISGEVVNAILLTITRGRGAEGGILGGSVLSDHLLRGLDVSDPRTADEKAELLSKAEIKSVSQAGQLGNPDARIMFRKHVEQPLLNTLAHSHHGLVSGDRLRMCVYFWEIVERKNIWIEYCGTVKKPIHYSGKDTLLRWCEGTGAIRKLRGATNLETHAWNKRGVVVSAMRELPVTLYTGMAFDNNTAVVTSSDDKNLPAIWCFCSSPKYNEAVRQIDQKLNVTNATLAKVPFDLEYWTEVAEEKYPNGLPEPYSDDPTQWIFHGHPCGSVVWDEEVKWTKEGPLRIDEAVLQTAVARLLGYRWPAERDPEMELADEQRAWVERCGELEKHADRDGIVCIPALRGEDRAADRLLKLLVDAYGEEWSNQTLERLMKSVGYGGKTLESWLRDKFFEQHSKFFKHRPFIWQIWDGVKKGGFSALVNYHKLDRRLLESLAYTYLGDWIQRQRDEVSRGIDGAEERLQGAINLQKSLQLILEGEAPYDIFVRWKKIEEQAMGWDPDLNDGVRMNIRPFMSVDDVDRKGAGVLRFKPNIHWKKDRGRDVPSAPWYKLGPKYGEKEGARINDHHLMLAEKKKARGEGDE